MASVEERLHEEWLGMVQPVDGLVVSIPVLVEAQCLSRQPPDVQRRLAALCRTPDDDAKAGEDATAGRAFIDDLPGFVEQILGWASEHLVSTDALPAELSLYVPEGGQIIRPTAAVRAATPTDSVPRLLLWDLGRDCMGLPLDKPETRTGPWEYPAAAKFDRLLRHTRIPIGVLTNRTELRLLYAPHGELSGSITFRVADMLEVGGRPILDALVMLLGATRLFGVAPERQLPAILSESRKRQANVTNELAAQVFDALQILLAGFEAAAERDGRAVLDAAYAREGDHLYGGLLTQLLRLVFVLYAEDRGLLPVESELYAEHLSVLGLYEELQTDQGAHSDSMSRRFGAYGRLIALFRAIYLGIEHGDLRMPARRGQLFSPHEYPFLEGWDGEPGSAPIADPVARAATRLPTVDDETVFRVLEKLLILRRQRLSYRALDVEQIGSVYEALMGYHVVRLEAEAVCLRPSRVWVTADEVLTQKPATRTKWLQEMTGMAKGQADKVSKALAGVKKPATVFDALDDVAVASEPHRQAGRLVIQPGAERRRTSSHYTPRSLTAPIVQKTLDPLFRAMGEHPPSEQILNLKICDPAMGSGAFLVEACRYLADQVVVAWMHEDRRDLLGGAEDVVLLARRLVAQRCLYGVDKNPYAVNLAKLSLWLVTLARDLPFTFVDHALRHGDSLVGLSFDQIRSFHWTCQKQLESCRRELDATLSEAVHARQLILELAGDPSPTAQQRKEWLLRDSEDALDRVRLLGDLVIGAFFSSDKAKERQRERDRRLDAVGAWLGQGGPPPAELVALRADVRKDVPAFHWMAEFPEIFWTHRPDPLRDNTCGGRSWIEAFIGNPPFMGGALITREISPNYQQWLQQTPGANGNADLCAYFFRKCADLVGDAGTIGLIGTNTIAQGDTRDAGLKVLLAEGFTIHTATQSLLWPGTANVAVSTISMSKGCPTSAPELNQQPASHISSRLRDHAEAPDPVPLAANESKSFKGVFFLGEGFLFEDGNPGATSLSEMMAILHRSPTSHDCIFPFVSGEELNSSPELKTDRFIINFGDMTLREAECYPELLEIVRNKVKPIRDGASSAAHRERWWQFASRSTALFDAISTLDRCLVVAQVTKHLCFAFQPTRQVFSQKTFVFPFDGFSRFAVLQSRAHVSWVRLLSATMKNDISYSTTGCFDNFPFPPNIDQSERSPLEEAGRRLYEARCGFMVQHKLGMTKTYNLAKDPSYHTSELQELRELHLELDRQVLHAYGWEDLISTPGVPPYTTPRDGREKASTEQFEAALIGRLFALNMRIAADERVARAPDHKAAKRTKRVRPVQPVAVPTGQSRSR